MRREGERERKAKKIRELAEKMFPVTTNSYMSKRRGFVQGVDAGIQIGKVEVLSEIILDIKDDICSGRTFVGEALVKIMSDIDNYMKRRLETEQEKLNNL